MQVAPERTGTEGEAAAESLLQIRVGLALGGTTLAMVGRQGLVWVPHLHGELTSERDGWPETKPEWDPHHIVWVVPSDPELSVVPDQQQQQQ